MKFSPEDLRKIEDIYEEYEEEEQEALPLPKKKTSKNK